jgi:hypothetical protein
MIRINSDDVLFMLMMLQLTPDLLQVLQSITEGGVISDYQADELRDCCTDRLDEIGFDENYELTEEGAKLEILVDKLFIG